MIIFAAVQHPYGYTQFKEKLQTYEKAHFNSFHNLYEPAGEIPVDYLDDKNELVC